jgi:hypothetical protein
MIYQIINGELVKPIILLASKFQIKGIISIMSSLLNGLWPASKMINKITELLKTSII